MGGDFIILIIGGAFQGKKRFALEKLGIDEKRIFCDFHEEMKKYSDNGEILIEKILKGGYDAVISNEVGCGVVPADKGEREWRDAVGRGLCSLAEKCSQVWRVTMGIGIKIKDCEK